MTPEIKDIIKSADIRDLQTIKETIEEEILFRMLQMLDDITKENTVIKLYFDKLKS